MQVLLWNTHSLVSNSDLNVIAGRKRSFLSGFDGEVAG